MKKKMRNYLFSLVLLFLTIYLYISELGIQENIEMLLSVLGVMLVILQIDKSTSLTEGEFILNLQQTYADNDEFVELFLKCWDDFNNCDNETNSEEIDIKTLVNYLTFFESIYIMLEKGVVKIDLLDDLFGRRFFIVVNNKKVQDLELIKNYKYYKNIYSLHSIWKKYRMKQEAKEQKQQPNYKDLVINPDKKGCKNLPDYKDLTTGARLKHQN